MFRDPTKSGIVVVSLPEAMPTTETLELLDALRSDLDLPVFMLVINAMLHTIFADDERATLIRNTTLLDEARLTSVAGAAGQRDGLSDGERELALATRRAAREQIQVDSAQRLQDGAKMMAIVLPHLLESAGTPEGIVELSKRF
jgi:hypothetical protein